MKKTLAGLFLAAVFLVPSFSYAQTATQDEIRDQYQATLVQLISLLQQQVQSLMAQLQAQSADVAEIKASVKTSGTGNSQDPVVEAPALTSEVSVNGATTTISVSPKVYAATVVYRFNGGKPEGQNGILTDGKYLFVDLPKGSYDYTVIGYDNDKEGNRYEVGKTDGSFQI